MAKSAITDYSSTAASNTDVGGVDIQGSAAASNMDDGVREVMSHLADTNAGNAPWADTMTIGDAADLTKEVRFELSGITTATTRVLTVPNYDGTIATLAGTETLTNKTLTAPTITGLTGITVTSTDAGATAGPDVSIYRDSATPAASDQIGRVVFYGEDSAGNQEAYAFIGAVVEDPTSGSEDARLDLNSIVAGSLGARLRIANGIYTPSATGGDKGADTINASAVYINGSRLGGAPDAVLEDQKAAGTAGGTATSGSWETRTLNTEVRDPSGIISISSNEFTATVAGWVEWSAPAFAAGRHQTRLYNVTGAAAVAYGTPEETVAAVMTRSVGGAPVAANTAYRIEHQVSSTNATDGYGEAGNFGGTEVYTRVKFWRTA